MAIQVQVQTKADQQREMQDAARLKAVELQQNSQEPTPVVNAIDQVGIDLPEMTENKAIAEEIDKTPPANMNASQQINQGVPQSTLDMRKELNQQRAEYRAQQQRDLEKRKPISSEPGWSQYQDQTADAFGQSIERADKFTTLFHDKLENGSSIGGVWLDKPGTEAMEGFDVNITDITNPSTGKAISKYSPKGILFDKFGFNAGIKNQNGQLVVDPNFAKIMGYITETSLIGADPTDQSGFKREDEIAEPESFARTGSGQLGRKIYREWMRSKNFLEGKEIDDYNDQGIDANQYEVIGSLAKEMYHLANPDMLDRVTNKDQQTGDKKVEFQITPVGKARIRAAKKAMPEHFASEEIKPTSYPRPELDRGGRPGEASRLRKGETTKVINQKQKQIEIGRKNMNSISHVVDPKRRKIMMQLGIQALMEIKQTGTSKLGDLFDIGPKKLEYFQGELAKKQHENPGERVNYDPQKEYDKHIVKFIDAMKTASIYSGKNNHLDFAWQHLQNRMHVEQTKFNPQGNTWLRFITGSAKPSTWTVNDRSHADLMFKELMAIHFLGAKDLLPNNRIEAFNQDWNNPNGKLRAMVAKGKMIEDSLMNNELDQKTLGLFSQVTTSQAGETNASPELGNTPPLNVPQDLLNDAMHEGLEGLGLIEAAAELYRYSRGGSMSSFISPEFDGKTHGPASNMAMLGVESGAYRTGVLRREGATKNLDSFTVGEILESQGIDSTKEQAAGDLREGMKMYMLENGQEAIDNMFGSLDLVEPMWGVLNAAVKDRVNFLKKPPMTLGYGQLLKNLRGTVETTVFSGDASTEIKNIIDNARDVIETKAEKGQTAEDVVINFLHTIMADSINANMDPSVVEMGQLLRANNTLAILSNEVMTIQNALGFDTYIGAKQRQYTGEKIDLNVTAKGESGKVGSIPLSESKPAGSAVREGRVGGWGRGRVIPAVVQGVDGAWMNKMFTQSWPKLKNAYMLPIMDAVKTDLANARTVREEANKNWWNTIQEYDYINEIMGKWAPATINNFRKKLMEMNPDTKLPIDMESEFRGFGYLLDPSGPKGKPFKNLRDHIGDTMEFDPRKDGQSIIDYENYKNGEALKIARKMLPKLWDSKNTLTELTPKQMLDFFDRMVFHLKLKERNGKATGTTKRRRAALFDKAKNSEILQVDLG